MTEGGNKNCQRMTEHIQSSIDPRLRMSGTSVEDDGIRSPGGQVGDDLTALLIRSLVA